MSILINQNVIWFDVSMNQSFGMEVLNCEYQFCHVESNLFFVKSVLSYEESHKVSSR